MDKRQRLESLKRQLLIEVNTNNTLYSNPQTKEWVKRVEKEIEELEKEIENE